MSIKHSACHKCREQGKDTHGDNLVTFDDGGKFCFACGHSEKSTKYIPEGSPSIYSNFVHGSIPLSVKTDLLTYLYANEVDDHFTYDVSLYRAVLKDTLPEYYWGRNKAANPKVFTRGQVPFHIFSCGYDDDTLVVVEDPVSAIAVSRNYDSLPLFGSYFRPDWYRKLGTLKYKNIVFWMDHDKAMESMKYALGLRHLYKTYWIDTANDPKAYTAEQCSVIVENVMKKNKLIA